MTQRQALAKARRHIKRMGGNPKHLTARQSICSQLPQDAPGRKKRTCNSWTHPKDCCSGVPICSFGWFQPVRAFQLLGVPGFVEVIGGHSTWEESLKEIEERKYWA
jgi:hypothetical protein